MTFGLGHFFHSPGPLHWLKGPFARRYVFGNWQIRTPILALSNTCVRGVRTPALAGRPRWTRWLTRKNNNQPTECGLWQERAALGFQVPPRDDYYVDVDSQASTEELPDADAERRAFLKAFEADDQERRRDEALESALRA